MPERKPPYVFGLIGFVFNKKDNKPIENAHIRVLPDVWVYDKPISAKFQPPVIAETKSGKDGAYKLLLKELGEFNAVVSATNFEPISKRFKITRHEMLKMDFHLVGVPSPRKYIGNKSTLELHVPDCSWVALMAERNKVIFNTTLEATDIGYNGCYHCLRDLDTG